MTREEPHMDHRSLTGMCWGVKVGTRCLQHLGPSGFEFKVETQLNLYDGLTEVFLTLLYERPTTRLHPLHGP